MSTQVSQPCTRSTLYRQPKRVIVDESPTCGWLQPRRIHHRRTFSDGATSWQWEAGPACSPAPARTEAGARADATADADFSSAPTITNGSGAAGGSTAGGSVGGGSIGGGGGAAAANTAGGGAVRWWSPLPPTAPRSRVEPTLGERAGSFLQHLSSQLDRPVHGGFGGARLSDSGRYQSSRTFHVDVGDSEMDVTADEDEEGARGGRSRRQQGQLVTGSVAIPHLT